MRHGRNDKLRKLNGFYVHQRYPYRIDGERDYSRPVYDIRPRGFFTVLFTVEKPAHTNTEDFIKFMDTVKSLCDIPAPTPK